jgi:hypothetical protein
VRTADVFWLLSRVDLLYIAVRRYEGIAAVTGTVMYVKYRDGGRKSRFLPPMGRVQIMIIRLS